MTNDHRCQLPASVSDRLVTATLVLRLAGPLQCWSGRTRSAPAPTESVPTKSGVIGLLAAARGQRRTEDLSALTALRYGVRTDRPGRTVRDPSLPAEAVPLTSAHRYYLVDAVFLAVVAGDEALIRELDVVVRRPRLPLHLGRRDCPPEPPVTLGVRPVSFIQVLRTEPWQAPQPAASRTVTLPVLRDAVPGEPRTTAVRDEPVSFHPRNRAYGWRTVVREHVEVPHPDPPSALRPRAPLVAVTP